MTMMTLRQLKHQDCLDTLRSAGCTVIAIDGVMFLVKYTIANNLKISYLYNITEKDQYFLERIKPYIVKAGIFETEKEVVDAILFDMRQFENASNSSHFSDFVQFTTRLARSVKLFDDLFLRYNLNEEDIQSFNNIVSNLEKLMSNIKSHSSQINLP